MTNIKRFLKILEVRMMIFCDIQVVKSLKRYEKSLKQLFKLFLLLSFYCLIFKMNLNILNWDD